MARFVELYNLIQETFPIMFRTIPSHSSLASLKKRNLWFPTYFCFPPPLLLMLFLLPAMSSHLCMPEFVLPRSLLFLQVKAFSHSLELMESCFCTSIMYNYLCSYLHSLLEYMSSRKFVISTPAFNIFMGFNEVCFILNLF